jgi:hypothetical protein
MWVLVDREERELCEWPGERLVLSSMLADDRWLFQRMLSTEGKCIRSG